MNFTDHMKRNEPNGLFEKIQCGKHFSMSIQASNAHLCNPRTDKLDPSEYSEFEVVIYPYAPATLTTLLENIEHIGYIYYNVPNHIVQAVYDILCDTKKYRIYVNGAPTDIFTDSTTKLRSARALIISVFDEIVHIVKTSTGDHVIITPDHRLIEFVEV